LPRPSVERPVFLIIGGPNGSGKSSAYQDAGPEQFGRSFWIINPDLLAARIRDVEGLDLGTANLEAVQRIEAWLDASIHAHQTVGVETVLSTGKYRRLVALAKQLGFEVWLIYVLLDSPERNVERVPASRERRACRPGRQDRRALSAFSGTAAVVPQRGR
jgi:predicted ABC-type ATPase